MKARILFACTILTVGCSNPEPAPSTGQDAGVTRATPCETVADCDPGQICFMKGCSHFEQEECTADTCSISDGCVRNLPKYCDGCETESGCFPIGWCDEAIGEEDCTPGTQVQEEPDADLGGMQVDGGSHAGDTEVHGGPDDGTPD